MQSNVDRLDASHVSIEVGLDAAEVDEALDAAYSRVVQRAKVPGFRKGKVPRPILEAHYGKEVLYSEAADILVPKAYRRALDELDLEPIEQPELDVIEPLEQGKSFSFKAKVHVLPGVELGNYTGIKAKKPAVTVKEDEILGRLDALREQYAELVLADHDELGAGDFAVIDFDGFVDGHPFRGGSAKGYTIEAGAEGYLPGFAEGLMGMKKGDTREVPVQLPSDFRVDDLGGKTALFQVTLREIKRKEKPELNEDFAKSLGAETVEALTEQVRSSLQTTAEREAERVFTERVLEQVDNEAKVEVPEILISRHAEQHFANLEKNLAYRGLTIEGYLAELGKTEDEIKSEMRREAQVEVKRDLVIDAVRKAENIQPTDEELSERVKELSNLARAKDPDRFRKDLEQSGRMEAVRDSLAKEKTVRFIVDKAEPMPEGKPKKADKAGGTK